MSSGIFCEEMSYNVLFIIRFDKKINFPLCFYELLKDVVEKFFHFIFFEGKYKLKTALRIGRAA